MKPIQTLSIYRPPVNGKGMAANPTNKVAKPGSFLTQLQEQVGKTDTKSGLKISKHAAERMNQRNITITPDQWSKIDQKLSEAKSMGITDSLVLTDQAAMVVSASNKTVITVMNREEASKQIFSNINGTIVLD